MDDGDRWWKGIGGVFLDSNLQVLRFETLLQDSYQKFDTTGSILSDIIAIRLNSPPPMPFSPGMEALYDDLEIHVIPEPSTFLLAIVAFAGLSWCARRQRLLA